VNQRIEMPTLDCFESRTTRSWALLRQNLFFFTEIFANALAVEQYAPIAKGEL
jgi:hypothetical protein